MKDFNTSEFIFHNYTHMTIPIKQLSIYVVHPQSIALLVLLFFKKISTKYYISQDL